MGYGHGNGTNAALQMELPQLVHFGFLSVVLHKTSKEVAWLERRKLRVEVTSRFVLFPTNSIHFVFRVSNSFRISIHFSIHFVFARSLV